MIPVLEAVPNVSSGRDPRLLERMVEAAAGTGVDVVDVTSDPDHDRSVLTILGGPEAVVEACLRLGEEAARSIDLGKQDGVHPRVGALDVVPFVPLQGLSMARAVVLSRDFALRMVEELGIPVFLYAESSVPPGRGLAEIRGHGGFEGLRDAPDAARGVPLPDFPAGSGRVHPTAGATCVGARPLLLAWNVDVSGLEMTTLRSVARRLRERDGGLEGLRTLALELPRQGRRQISMNLEDVRNRDPFAAFRAIEEMVEEKGGRIEGTEIIGLRPDELLLAAGAERLSLLDPDPSPMVSSRLAEHVSRRCRHLASKLRDMASRCEAPLDEPYHRLLDLADELDPSPPSDEPE
ncbi:MAG: glutamate formiminotransferase [Gemmatimonadales bacterium]|nr:MAG: glutamate formiminotransferase [Gemmatimonadales bacterium]